MTEIINGVVGTIILFIFVIGIFCNYVVKKKYDKMFATMKNKGQDKNLLIIERDYRHGYLKDRVERIKVFVEKEYYEIKLCNIPLYAFEDFTISAVYFAALLGLTFTVILVALPQVNLYDRMLHIFFLSIEGLLLGTILMVFRTILGINAQRDIFKVNLCNYLENELELFDEAEKDDEGNLFLQKINIEDTKSQECAESSGQNTEFGSSVVFDFSDSRQYETKSVENDFDERALLQVLEEILG
ncbi:MAG: hypothetical protein CVU84_13675 [Firmicutes bacterium HGW-Firmicutes-1]|jgi:hypothetical protein|nr:MAG: hypothetical protein CVU84_13675 [Firmicutes bacterium HGW-Firmicutes-1]